MIGGYEPLDGKKLVEALQTLPKAKVNLQRQYNTKG